MRRLNKLVAVSLAVAAATACSDQPTSPLDSEASIATATYYAVGPAQFDLIAGQNTVVGTVTATGDPAAGTFNLTYDVTGSGWCITETHWDIQDAFADFPLAGKPGKQNPKVGHFTYGDGMLPCVFTYSETVDGPVGGTAPWVVAAHAVVQGYDGPVPSLVFGIRDAPNDQPSDDGDIYLIDPMAGTTTLVADLSDPSVDIFSPNGLALDKANLRLYFSSTDGPATSSTLYYYDVLGGGSAVMAGAVPGKVYNATFYGGEYYFIPNRTDDLRKVTFDGAGVNGVASTVCTNIGASEGLTDLLFGDVAMDGDGMLYGVARHLNDLNPVHWFVLDPVSCEATFTPKTYGLLQIAFAADGTLYGHHCLSAGGTCCGNWWEIDPATGDIGSVVYNNDVTYTDLADGFFEPATGDETAWAGGTGSLGFPGASWATYFEYWPPPD